MRMRRAAELRPWLEAAARQLGGQVLERLMLSLGAGVRMSLEEEWPFWAHRGQDEPAGDWRVWLMMAGRGFGKTRAGAEWVSARAREVPGARIALVGATVEEVVKVMVSGQSGLVAVARTGEAPEWRPAARELRFPSGAVAFAYSGERPDKLRGPEHHFAWCDELAKWRRAEEAWDNLQMGLRLGAAPRTVVTTTPRPIAALRTIEALARTATTRGRTFDNPHLPADFREAMTAIYAGTRIGRQELDGVLFDDVEGALWTREAIEAARAPAPRRLVRVVVGVDPPASVDGDACGIVVCGLGADPSPRSGRPAAYVLADHSVAGMTPQGWAAKVAAAAEAWAADRIVAEANNGGKMVEAVLRGACVTLPVKLVHAAEGKSARAEPVTALFESGLARLAGAFPALEDEMCGMTTGGGYAGPGRSPDRADAMVWAMTELLLGARSEPRIRSL